MVTCSAHGSGRGRAASYLLQSSAPAPGRGVWQQHHTVLELRRGAYDRRMHTVQACTFVRSSVCMQGRGHNPVENLPTSPHLTIMPRWKKGSCLSSFCCMCVPLSLHSSKTFLNDYSNHPTGAGGTARGRQPGRLLRRSHAPGLLPRLHESMCRGPPAQVVWNPLKLRVLWCLELWGMDQPFSDWSAALLFEVFFS